MLPNWSRASKNWMAGRANVGAYVTTCRRPMHATAAVQLRAPVESLARLLVGIPIWEASSEN